VTHPPHELRPPCPECLEITIDVFCLIYAGKVPARKSGRRWLVPVASVEERPRARKKRDEGAEKGEALAIVRMGETECRLRHGFENEMG
jgi:hypothetical protein